VAFWTYIVYVVLNLSTIVVGAKFSPFWFFQDEITYYSTILQHVVVELLE
jgi:hypothetical protein